MWWLRIDLSSDPGGICPNHTDLNVSRRIVIRSCFLVYLKWNDVMVFLFYLSGQFEKTGNTRRKLQTLGKRTDKLPDNSVMCNFWIHYFIKLQKYYLTIVSTMASGIRTQIRLSRNMRCESVCILHTMFGDNKPGYCFEKREIKIGCILLITLSVFMALLSSMFGYFKLYSRRNYVPFLHMCDPKRLLYF